MEVNMLAEKLEIVEMKREMRKETSGTSEGKASTKLAFNIAAAPFEPPKKKSVVEVIASSILIGPTKVPVNPRIWDAIASTKTLPVLPQRIPSPMNVASQRVYIPPIFNASNVLNEFDNHPPAFNDDYSRPAVFIRSFGPVAHPEGFIEVRLRENISVLISLDRSVLVNNPNGNVKIAVSSGNMMAATLEHSNGKVYQQFDRVDIISYDGSKKLNRFVRYAKMWEKGISLTADGCALIYLVDQAGTRTTSDAVNKDIRNEYSWQVFSNNARLGAQYYGEAEMVAKNYHFFTQTDGSQVFDIHGFRVSQTPDGMVRISRSNDRIKIHTSPTNGSATLTTPHIHCTASLGATSHLFVRRDEKRMHFDGTTFVVRNAGHSAGFDENNNLRVY